MESFNKDIENDLRVEIDKLFDMLDRDQNGVLTPEELDAIIKINESNQFARE